VLAGERAISPPTIDGKISEGEYPKGATAPTFYDPFTGQSPKDATSAWLTYDADAIYVAFRCEDAGPLAAQDISPGSSFDSDDYVTFRIDPYGTGSQADLSKFRVNPLNTQSEYIAGGRAAKREWRGEWQSATSKDATGWTVEMRIPWKIFTLPSAGTRTLRFNLERVQRRTRIESRWSNNGIQERSELNALWTGVEIPKVSDRSKPQFLAYVAPEIDAGTSQLRTGVDVRYAFNPQLTGLLSVAPDFKNIESQVEGIDFSRTERYLDDARPFFNEGGDYFNLTGQFTWGRAFYSRRIGELDLGAKVYGKLDPYTDVGFLTAAKLDEETTTVFKLRRSGGARQSNSIYATAQDKHGQTRNQFVGYSGFSSKGNFEFRSDLAATYNQGPADTAGSFLAGYSCPKWFSIIRYQWVEPTFTLPLGYVPWTDRKGAYWYTEHNNEYRSGRFSSFHTDLYMPAFFNYNGDVQQRGLEWSASVVDRRDIRYRLAKGRTQYGEKFDDTTTAGLTINQSNRYKRFGVDYNWGKVADEKSSFFSGFATVRVLDKVDLGFQQSVFSFSKDRSEQTVATIGWEINAKQSLSGRYVKRDSGNNVYFAYRSAGFSGTELYVIVGDPNADRWRNRVSVKMVWAF
jgi:hypothetical protein